MCFDDVPAQIQNVLGTKEAEWVGERRRRVYQAEIHSKRIIVVITASCRYKMTGSS